ncbi:MAG: hypothetical protein ACLUV8_06365 [Clostridium sp.]
MSGVIDLHSAFVLFDRTSVPVLRQFWLPLNDPQRKRATAIHLLFNLIGTVVFAVLSLVTPFTDVMISLAPGAPWCRLQMSIRYSIWERPALLPSAVLVKIVRDSS